MCSVNTEQNKQKKIGRKRLHEGMWQKYQTKRTNLLLSQDSVTKYRNGMYNAGKAKPLYE